MYCPPSPLRRLAPQRALGHIGIVATDEWQL